MTLSKKNYWFSYFFILLTCSHLASNQGYTQKHCSEAINYHLGSFGGQTTLDKDEKKKEEPAFLERVKNYFKYKEVPAFTRPLSDAQKRNLLITEVPLRIYDHISPVVDTKLLYDERIFNGGERPYDNFFARITPFVSTLAGERHMLEVLSQPIADITLLNRRQAAAKEIVANPELLNSLSATLMMIKENELSFLQHYIDKTDTEKEAVDQLLFGKWLGLGDALNANSAALEVKRRFINALQFIATTYPFLISGYVGYKIERILKQGSVFSGLKKATLSVPFPITFLDPRTGYYKNKMAQFKEVELAMKGNDYPSILNSINNLTPEQCKIIGFENSNDIIQSFSKDKEQAYTRVALEVTPRSIGDLRAFIDRIQDEGLPKSNEIPTLLRSMLRTGVPLIYGSTALGMWGSFRNAKFENDITLCLQQQIIQLSRYVRGCEHLYITIKNNPTLYKNLELIDHLKALVERSRTHSDDFNKLIDLLDSKTFSDSASFFSLVGKVLAAQTIITKVRSEFKGMVQALGEIDFTIATAKLYNHFAGTKTPYCFPEYIYSETPYLKASNFWNPFLNPEGTVVNSLEFGSETNPRTMILTGPNTGGKSTCIEGILFNALCAQTLGIAPAQQLTLTPFAKITLYARITDDIGAGDSRFQAEVKASKKQLETARNIQPREFSLNIRDEGIVGTDREVGEGAEERFTTLLANTPNSINLCSTHYKKMIKLESSFPELFKNYHMQISRSESGKLIRHFTIGEGASTINIAMDILQEQGIV